MPWPQGTLLSNVAWAYAFATTLLGRREGILLDVAGRAGRAASFMPLPFSFPLPRLEKDEDFLDAVRAQLRALGQEQDGKVSMRRPAAATLNKAGMIGMWTEVGQAN